MKTHQMFLVHTTPRNLKTQQRALILNLCWRKSRDAIIFEGSIFKMFSVHTKTKTQCFQIPPVRRAFSKSSVLVTD